MLNRSATEMNSFPNLSCNAFAGSRPSRAKVLVVRCCRTPVFINAVKTIRKMHPDAEIWGLAQPEYHPEIESCVDRLLSYPARRYSPFRIPISLLVQIRRMHFDAVAIPYMHSLHVGYTNVHHMAALFAASRLMIIPAGAPVQTYDRKKFRNLILWNLFKGYLYRFDIPLVFLGLFLSLFRILRTRCSPPQTSKKRVLHIINSLAVGGAQVQLAELIEQTPQDRYEIEILVLDHQDGDFSRYRFRGENVPVLYLATWPCRSAALWEIMRICRRRRYDIVHTWLFMSNVLGTAAARLAGCPRIIASVRNLSLWKRTWYNAWWFRPADFFASRLPDVVTVNGRSLVADHARWALYPQKRIVVVPNGLQPEQVLPATAEARMWVRAELGLAATTPVIGTVGRLAPEKDHAVFLQIINQLRQDLPSIHALIVGDGELRGSLERQADELGLTDIVHFVGEHKESRRFIAGLDLFLLTSRIEGFPNVLLEAAFSGVPCLSTDVGAVREILNDSGSTFPAGDVEAGYRKAKDSLMNPESAHARADQVQKWVARHFTAEKMASHWLSLYEGASPLGGYVYETRSDPMALLP